MTSKHRSKFEAAMGSVLEPAGFSYEPHSYEYHIRHNYTPDWYITKGNKEFLIEGKGWFRPGDRQKYKAIRDSLEVDEELVFLLMHPNKKVQKGAALTMSQWCTKECIPWFSDPEGVISHVDS